MKIIIISILFVVCCAAMQAADTLSWLRVEEGKIVDQESRPVQLRGVNLGGWLVEEMWMMPFKTHPPKKSNFSEVRDHVSLWNVLKQRFTKEEVEEIRTALRKNWLTEEDFARIRAAGFNCVRVPFLYDLVDEQKGLFPWLDFAINMASKHNLYVIVDMHGAPGRQSKSDHTGEEKKDQLFSDHAQVEKAAKIWASIAQRYMDRPCVAGYDLLNEPMGASNTATLYLVQDRLYQAIRRHDSRHLVIFEDGFKGVDRMPNPRAVGWHNVLISAHLYTKSYASEEEMEQKMQGHYETFSKQQKELQVPIYIGEFNFEKYSTLERIKSFILEMQKRNFSWVFWTYKVIGSQEKGSMWGLYTLTKEEVRIDPFRDSKKEILKKIEKIRTEQCDENSALVALFREA